MAVYLRGSSKKRHRHSGECKTWYYKFMVRGKRYRRRVPEASTKAQAEQAETIERHKVYQRKYGKASGDRNFADFVNEAYLPAKINNRSFRENDRHAKLWITYFGKEALGDISQEMIERAKTERVQLEKRKDVRRRPSTINREMWALSGIFTLAVEYEELAINPCRKIESLRKDNTRARHLSTDLRFHDLRHTFGTRLADAVVDLVKIKELMGHQCIETTMRYLHTTDKGKRGAITQLSEYRQMKVGSSLSQISLTSRKTAVNG